MAKQSSYYPTDTLFRGIKTLLTSLPTEEERRELVRTLSETQSFLKDLQDLVEAIPTTESSRDLSEGLSRLDILAERAGTDAGLRRLLGLRPRATSRPNKIVSTEDAMSRAVKLKEELSGTDTSNAAALLERSREPLSVLTVLAGLLGMRTRSKERKAELIQRIATHIENRRGYRLLRGEER